MILRNATVDISPTEKTFSASVVDVLKSGNSGYYLLYGTTAPEELSLPSRVCLSNSILVTLFSTRGRVMGDKPIIL